MTAEEAKSKLRELNKKYNNKYYLYSVFLFICSSLLAYSILHILIKNIIYSIPLFISVLTCIYLMIKIESSRIIKQRLLSKFHKIKSGDEVDEEDIKNLLTSTKKSFSLHSNVILVTSCLLVLIFFKPAFNIEKFDISINSNDDGSLILSLNTNIDPSQKVRVVLRRHYQFQTLPEIHSFNISDGIFKIKDLNNLKIELPKSEMELLSEFKADEIKPNPELTMMIAFDDGFLWGKNITGKVVTDHMGKDKVDALAFIFKTTVNHPFAY